MKKYIILPVVATLLFAACRKDADFNPYIGETGKLAYSNYTEQFQYLWKCLNTGYVFWDVDTVDWDAAYNRYLPIFEELDRKFSDSGYVRTAELEEIYSGLTGKLLDHHMLFLVKNLHPQPGDTYPYAIIEPGFEEVQARDYYIEDRWIEQSNMITFLSGLENDYTVTNHSSAEATIPENGSTIHIEYCIFTLSDGRKVPYLWTTEAALSPIMRDHIDNAAQSLIDQWLTTICNTPRNQLAGIILDQRSNSGGYQDDLDYLIGPFINQRTEMFKTRYKEGPGKLEYSAWCPYYQYPNPDYHRDITAENIPYVILTDINSVSMAEIGPLAIRKLLPTAHIIGERTWGGTGPLQNNAVNLNYGGPFGDYTISHHYVYTSTFETIFDDKVLEGIGVIPDEEVLRINDPNHSFKPQLDAALTYLLNH